MNLTVSLDCFGLFPRPWVSSQTAKSHQLAVNENVVFAAQAVEPEIQPHHNRNTLLLDKLRSTTNSAGEGNTPQGTITHTHPLSE